MRYIKFKAKRVDNGEWVRGWYIDGYICSDLAVADCENFMPAAWCKVDPETICQYTGLKDRNGKEIWEGDKVKHNMPISNLIDIVVYERGGFILKGKGSLSAGVLEGCYGGCEVIGNIHDKEEE